MIFISLVVSSTPPKFQTTPANRTVVRAQELIILLCISKPPALFPTVWDWRKDGKLLSADDIKSERITSSSGQLLIRSATSADSGNYTCNLVNTAGNITSPQAEVIVHGKLLLCGVFFHFRQPPINKLNKVAAVMRSLKRSSDNLFRMILLLQVQC